MRATCKNQSTARSNEKMGARGARVGGQYYGINDDQHLTVEFDMGTQELARSK